MAKGHVIPEFECNSCGRCLKHQKALEQHKSTVGHWEDSSTSSLSEPENDFDDSDFIQKGTPVMQPEALSQMNFGMLKVEENINDNKIDDTTATIHMQYLSFEASQEQDEFLSSPLLTVPLLNDSLDLQFGLFGGSLSESGPILSASRIFHNVTCPSSVFICGSQGSGKSHTLACLLENCLLPSNLGNLPHPLAGVVFHYDTFMSDTNGRPCEAAFLASHGKTSVRILCAPTSFRTIQSIYRVIPQVDVERLEISDQDLNTRRMFDLMAVREGEMPLYLHVVERILRDMRLQQQETGLGFSYASFKKRLDREELSPAQRGPLNQRLDTLESFMPKAKAKAVAQNSWMPKAGQLTIIDLSCPCITAEMACLLFNICLSLFLEQKSNIGKVVALDEAHKYLKQSDESQVLTNSLLETVRLQRHLGTRVFISTQEPTVSTKLLDLCSMTVVHRFTSPNWLQALRGHLAGLASLSVAVMGQDESIEGVRPIVAEGKDQTLELFAKIISLRTGQALVFAPSAVIGLSTKGQFASDAFLRLAHRPLRIQVRSRLTTDGGKTVMA